MARKSFFKSLAIFIALFITVWAFIKNSIIAFIISFLITFFWLIARSSRSQKRKVPQPLDAGSFKINVSVSTGPYFPDFKPTSNNGDDFWIPSLKTGTVSSPELGGMIYFGKGLAAISGNGPEPALIDPSLPATSGIQDCTVRRLSYWPYYRGASPEARGAYLRWLSTGRQDPAADLGYVFLYFYGLERRALHDTKLSLRAREEIASIKTEIERLLKIYTNSGSFQSYAGSLLDVLQSQNDSDILYKENPPPLRMCRFLTLKHKLILAQYAKESAPLPTDWAYVWLLSDPNTHLPTPAYRCPEEFRRLFYQQYQDTFGDGMILPQGHTRLKVEHRPASPSFSFEHSKFEANIDLPDISTLSVQIKELQDIAEDCALKLKNYSRLIGKDKNCVGQFDAIIELPLSLWPDEYRLIFEQFHALIVKTNKPSLMRFKEFLSRFPKMQDLTRQKMNSFYRVLAEAGLGIEPDIRFGGAVPEHDSYIVLFIDDKKTRQVRASAQYMAMALILQLGAGVAASDGEIADVEKDFLLGQMEKWFHLNESEQKRLQAKLHLWQIEPPSNTGLKKRIEILDNLSRESIGDFLSIIALADEKVTNDEIRRLEKLFTSLGLDPKTIYTRLQLGATEPVTVRTPEKVAERYAIPKYASIEPTPLVKLNAKKIKELQEDSERVSNILGTIFSQASYEPEPQIPDSGTMQDEEEKESIIERLDKEYSALISILLSRLKWSRAELEQLASDRNLMIDGVLESINDAFYSQYNKPFFEGYDPIEISQEIIREASK